MKQWNVKVLYLGGAYDSKSGLTPNLDEDLFLEIPHLQQINFLYYNISYQFQYAHSHNQLLLHYIHYPEICLAVNHNYIQFQKQY